MRGSDWVETSRRSMAWLFPAAGLRPLTDAPLRGVAEGTRNSFIVFHCPQLGQRPTHFWASCPHSEQTKTIFCLAIRSPSLFQGCEVVLDVHELGAYLAQGVKEVGGLLHTILVAAYE